MRKEGGFSWYIGPDLENQEEACESLKSPIALDS
jgi:hypothetical protein